MSSAIEERIVKMVFDNGKFEENANTSMKTIDKLKEKLNFTSAGKGLENIADAAKSVDFSFLAGTVETVGTKFSLLEQIAIGALRRIGEQAIQAGENLVKSVSIDQVTAGWDKYAEKTTSVQTIMAATADQFEDQAEQMDYVTDKIEKLNWFTDETSYNLTDMTNNIGKFTSAGVDLDTATIAMEGIAAATALAGQNSQAASRVMYNFSQALGAGAVKLQDWMSVENANVATKEFKETVIETAKELGVLSKDTEVTYKNFRESLKEGWFSSEVLTATLQKYGGFAMELNDVYDKFNESEKSIGFTTSEIIGYIDEFQNGTVDLKQLSKDTGMSVDELSESLTRLGSEELALGRKAFKAAQEAKTFEEAIDATKDAVSTAWMNTFETIFGNYLEAKVLWTDLANYLYDVFAEPVNNLNEKLTNVFKIDGVKDNFFGIFKNLARIIEEFIAPIQDAFATIFPEKTAREIADIINRISFSLAQVTIEGEKAEKLQSTFQGLFAIFKIIGTVVKDVVSAFRELFGNTLKQAGDGVLGITAKWGDWLTNLSETLETSHAVKNAILDVAAWIGDRIDWIRDKFEVIRPFIEKVVEKIKEFLGFLKEKWDTEGLTLVHKALEKVHEFMGKVAEKAEPLKEALKSVIDWFKELITIDKISSFFQGLAVVFGVLYNVLKKVGDIIGTVFKSIFDALKGGGVGAAVDVANGGIFAALLLTLKKFISEGKEIFSGVSDILGSLQGILESYQKSLKADALIKIAEAIAILAGSLLVLSLIDVDKLLPAVGAISLLFYELTTALGMLGGSSSGFKGALSGFIDSKSLANIAKSLTLMAGAVLILSGALKLLSTMNWQEMALGLTGLTILLGELVAVSKLMKGQDMVSGSLGMILLATSLVIMASAVKSFGSMNWEELGKGLLGFTGVLGALVGASKLLGDTKMVKGSVGLILLAAAMKIFYSAVKDFSTFNIKELGIGMLGFAASLAAVTAAMKFLPAGADMIGDGLGMIAVAGAMLMIANVVEKFGDKDLIELGKGLGAMAIALAEIVLAMNLATGAIGGAAAILIVSAALLALTVPMSILGAMPLENIGKGLLALGGGLAIMLAAGALATLVAPGLLALSASLIAVSVASIGLGAGLALIGAGLAAVGVGFNLLATLGAAGATAVVAALTTIITGIIGLFPSIAKEIANGIVVIVTIITENVPAIVKMVVEFLKAIIPALNEIIPLLVDFVLRTVSSVLTAIGEYVPSIVDSVLQLIVDILEGIANRIPDIIQAGVDIIVALITGIGDSALQLINAGMQVILDFINGLAESIRTNTPLMTDAVNNLMGAIIDSIIAWFTNFVEQGVNILTKVLEGLNKMRQKVVDAIKDLVGKMVTSIKDKVGEFKDAAHNLISGFIEGVKEKVSAAVDAVKDFGGRIVSGIKDVFDINSPSRVAAEIGYLFDKGLAQGIEGEGKNVVKTSYGLGNATVAAMEEALSSFSNVIDGNAEFNPVLRPVLDLTDVENGVSAIDKMFTDSQIAAYNMNQKKMDLTVNSPVYLDGKLMTNYFNTELGVILPI